MVLIREISQRIVKDPTVKHFFMSNVALKARASFSESGMAIGGRLEDVGSFDVLVSSEGEFYLWKGGGTWPASHSFTREVDGIGSLLHTARDSSELRVGAVANLLEQADKTLKWETFADYGEPEEFRAHILLSLTKNLRNAFAACSQKELTPVIRT